MNGKVISLLLLMLLAGSMALAAPCAAKGDSSSNSSCSFTYEERLAYLAGFAGGTDQTIDKVGPGYEVTTDWQVGLVNIDFWRQTAKTEQRHNDGTCGPSEPIHYPPTTDTHVWSPPSNTTTIPCPPPTDPDYPGDQPPYVNIPDQTWSTP